MRRKKKENKSRVNRVSRAAFQWLPPGGNRNNTDIVEIQKAVIQKYRGKRKQNQTQLWSGLMREHVALAL